MAGKTKVNNIKAKAKRNVVVGAFIKKKGMTSSVRNGSTRPESLTKQQRVKINGAKVVAKRKATVDAWDTGLTERLEETKARAADTGKRIKFEPAPATFTLPSREEHLRSQFGEFAGPLLGSIWESENSSSKRIIDFTPTKASDTTEISPKKANPFGALASDSEEEKDTVMSVNKVAFRPATLDMSKSGPLIAPVPTLVTGGGVLFKPATINVEQFQSSLSKPSSSSSTQSASIEFKPSVLQSINHVAKGGDDFDDL